jgi:DUF4097 and DUF4098 domain-containing protein YvlB
MHRIATLAALLAAPLVAAPAQQQVDIARRTAPDIALRLTGAFTKLRITAWEHDSVTITGNLPKGHRFDGGFGTSLVGPPRGSKWYIDDGGTGGGGGTLEMRVPARARVYVKGYSADVEASGIAGELDLNVIGGSVRVNASPRTLSIEAMDASVAVDGSPAWLRLKTSEGDITMRGSSPDAVITTVSGAISVGNGTYERAKLETVSGSIVFAGDVARAASVEIGSHSGPVELFLDPGASVEIDAITLTASIENLLTKQRAIPGRDRGQELGLELGTGDGRVEIRTFKAGIRLARRVK